MSSNRATPEAYYDCLESGEGVSVMPSALASWRSQGVGHLSATFEDLFREFRSAERLPDDAELFCKRRPDHIYYRHAQGMLFVLRPMKAPSNPHRPALSYRLIGVLFQRRAKRQREYAMPGEMVAPEPEHSGVVAEMDWLRQQNVSLSNAISRRNKFDPWRPALVLRYKAIMARLVSLKPAYRDEIRKLESRRDIHRADGTIDWELAARISMERLTILEDRITDLEKRLDLLEKKDVVF